MAGTPLRGLNEPNRFAGHSAPGGIPAVWHSRAEIRPLDQSVRSTSTRKSTSRLACAAGDSKIPIARAMASSVQRCRTSLCVRNRYSDGAPRESLTCRIPLSDGSCRTNLVVCRQFASGTIKFIEAAICETKSGVSSTAIGLG